MKYALKIVFIPALLCGITLLLFTGLLQKQFINVRDISHWTYNHERINGTNAFFLSGNTTTCWLLIHSYAATPVEMKELGKHINDEFGDTVAGMRLSGHGEVPSRLQRKTLEIWYEESLEIFSNLASLCDEVNVVGSSLGAVLAARLAEEHDLGRLYLLNIYFSVPHRWYYILKADTVASLLAGPVTYVKKWKTAQINDPEGLKRHIAYRNFPLAPVIASVPFIEETKNNASKIEEPLLLQHSKRDRAADPIEAERFFFSTSSTERYLVWLMRSNHVLLLDYDSARVIENILLFEHRYRKGV